MKLPFLPTLFSSALCVASLTTIQAQITKVSQLDGTNGFTINGDTSRDPFARSVSGIGDINHDGFADLAAGSITDETPQNSANGIAYIIYGTSAGFPSEISIADIDGTNGFKIAGENSIDFLGNPISGAGDVNGDGIDDVVVAAVATDPGGLISAGTSYIVFGRTQNFPETFNVSEIDGTNGFAVNGSAQYDNAGESISSAGDMNGDGFDDLLIGSPNIDSDRGECYVVFGKASGFPAELTLSSLDGTNGFKIRGEAEGDEFAETLSGVGDVNGDGFDDILIGAARATSAQSTGEAYLMFGSGSEFPAEVMLSDFDGSYGITFSSSIYGLATEVGGAGDVNGDGLADIMVSADLADIGPAFFAGKSHVIFGQKSFPSNFELSNLNGTNGFAMNGIAEVYKMGYSSSGVGDVNGDGFADMLFSAIGVGSTQNAAQGEHYLIFGKDTAYPPFLDLSTLSPSDGFTFRGVKDGDNSGISTSGIGDLNNDGFSDFIVGADFADSPAGERAGQAYVILGFSNAATSFTTTHQAYAKPGDAPRSAIGLTGDGSDNSSPTSRAWIDFSSGDNGAGEASLQTVVLTRSNDDIENITDVANVLWQITTDRTSPAAVVSFKYFDAEISALMETDLKLFQASSPTGPWREVTSATNPFGGANPELAINQISGAVTNANGYYTIGTVVPEIEVDDMWMTLGN